MSGRRINARDAKWWTGDTTTTLQNILKYAEGRSIVVYLPYEDGSPWSCPKEGFFIDRFCEMYGDGYDEGLGLRFWADPAIPDQRGTKDSRGVVLGSSEVYLHDLCISNNRGPVEKGEGHGIAFFGTPTQMQEQYNVARRVTLERVSVLYAGGHGFFNNPPRDPGAPSGEGFIILSSFRDSLFFACARSGIRIAPASTTLLWDNLNLVGNGEYAAHLSGCINSKLNAVVGEDCGRGLPDGAPDANFYIENCNGMDLTLYSEAFNRGKAKNCVRLHNVRDSVVRPGANYEWDRPGLTAVRLNSCQRVTVEPQACTESLAYAVYDEGRKSKDCTIFEQSRPISISTRNNYVIGERSKK